MLSLFWQAMRILFLALWMIGLARALGAEGFGTYSGVTGIAITLGCFSGLGLGLVMYQDAVNAPHILNKRFGEALWMNIASGLFFFSIFLIVCSIVFEKLTVYSLIAIGLSEVLLYPIVSICAFALASSHKIGWSSALQAITAIFRCLGILAFLFTSTNQTINDYVWYHLFATTFATIFIVFLAKKILSIKILPLHKNLQNINRGFEFCFSWAGTNAITSIDKSIVLKIGGGEMAGLYSSSSRLVTIFIQPIDALVNAATPKLFKIDQNNKGLIKRILFTLIAYCIVTCPLLFYLSDYFIWILGESFISAKDSIKWFSLIVPCYAMRTLGTYILVTSNRIKIKLAAEFIGICILLLTGLTLIPTLGLHGTVIMIVATEISIATICWLAIITRYQYQK